jgi:hypothetical protein
MVSRKLMEAARRMWPGLHGDYEEMCALAAAGQLGGPQMHLLSEHRRLKNTPPFASSP